MWGRYSYKKKDVTLSLQNNPQKVLFIMIINRKMIRRKYKNWSVSPSIRVFPSESALCIRWPKSWSFSFSISPSNEYSGLISFRMDWEENMGYFFFIFSLSSPSFPLSPASDWTLENKMKFRLDFVSNPLRIIAMYMNLGMSEHLAKCTSKINLKNQIL